MTTLIGLTGRAGSGKDTAAEALVAHMGYVQYALAQPIKRMIAALFPTDIDLSDRAVKETEIPGLGYSPRYLMQTLGTEWGRQTLRESFWLDVAEGHVVHARVIGRPIVISDIRFDNESRWIHKHGGVVIQILRNSADDAAIQHASEAGVSPLLIDYSIRNHGSIQEFQADVVKRVTSLTSQRLISSTLTETLE